MTGAKLIAYGIVSEQSAILALFSNQPVWARLSLFLVGHAIASVTLSLVLTAALPSRYEVKRWSAMALFGSFTFFIPLFGAVGMVLILLYFRYFQRYVERTEFFTVSLPPFMVESGGPAPGMGEGGAWARLRTDDLPRPVRLQALLAVSTSGGHNSSRLLQMATSDNDDEIRLLAFNLFERREKVIGATISDTLRELRTATHPEEQLPLYRRLAFSYWEVVFNELANRELRAFFIKQALHYAHLAHELAMDDSALMVLLGRIYLVMGDTDKAQTYIDAALAHGAHRDRVISYLAELAYRRRDFASLKDFFEQYPLLRYKPGIGPVAKFWMGA